MQFEIPIVVEIEAEDRADAEEKATDLADSMSEVFGNQATAVLTTDHNLLDRLKIDPAGVSS